MDKTKRIAVLEDMVRELSALLAKTIDHHSYDIVWKDEVPRALTRARDLLAGTKNPAPGLRFGWCSGNTGTNLGWVCIRCGKRPATQFLPEGICDKCCEEEGWKPTNPATEPDRIYPCKECGTMRTKAEGGTTFTVCDACWDKAHQKATTEPDMVLVRREVIKAALRTPGMYVGVAEELIAALEGKALVPWLGFKGTP